VLPASIPSRLFVMLVFAAVIVGFNFPGDIYLFEPNDFFYHPEWVPGKWVEDQVLLYHRHLDAIILIRLPSLLLCTFTIGGVVLWRRWFESAERRRSITAVLAPNPAPNPVASDGA
jgi:hypothetical protein